MRKIDISKWKSFYINEIFITNKIGETLQVPTGAMVPQKILKEGDIPRVTVSNFNNGITGYYAESLDKNYKVYENFISVSFLGTVFYQKDKASLDMKVHCLKPISYKLDIYTATFLVTIIRQTLSNYVYQDQLSSTLLATLSICLPQDTDGNPNWKYMKQCGKIILETIKKNFDGLLNIDNNKNKIELNRWKKFHLYEDFLFDIDMGTKFDKSKMAALNPSINFVGRANANNGITACVDKIKDVKPYTAGNMTLSLGGEYLGSCFIQPKEFYTSQNVIVLIPKWNMPTEVKLFISTMIFRESRTHYKAFVDELNRHIKTDFSFYLPISDDENPDWIYMENYMKNVMEDTQSKLDKLAHC